MASFDHHGARIDTDPKEHPATFRLTIVRLSHSHLDFDSAPHRIEHARKFGKDAVSGRICNSTSMSRNALIDKHPPSGQRGHRCLFVAVHQKAVTLDVRREDSSETPREQRIFHASLISA